MPCVHLFTPQSIPSPALGRAGTHSSCNELIMSGEDRNIQCLCLETMGSGTGEQGLINPAKISFVFVSVGTM